MKKWLIVQAYWYFDTLTGEYHYRVKQPSLGLSQTQPFQVIDIHVFHPFFPQLAETADLLILHLLPDIEAKAMIDFRRKRGLPTFFEIADNFLQVGPWVPLEDAHRNPEIRQNILTNAARCDALQLNNSRLLEPFGSLNPDIHLFENQMDRLAPVFNQDETFTIGWGGSIGHRDDLLQVRNALRDFLISHPSSRFSYMGQKELYDDLFHDFPTNQTIYTPAGPIEAYDQFIKTLDVGIAPLLDTGFNYCRSDIKNLEYGAFGTASLLSRTPAYTQYNKEGDTALFFDSPAEFTVKLETLFSNRTLMTDIANRNAKAIADTRWWLTSAELKTPIYRKYIRTEPKELQLPELPNPANLMNYLRLGLFHMDQGNFSKSLNLLDKAIAQLPSYHQAQYWRRELLLRMEKYGDVLESASNNPTRPSFEPLMISQICAAAKVKKPAQYETIYNMIQDITLREALEPGRIPPADILKEYPYHYRSLEQVAQHALLSGEYKPEWYRYFETGYAMNPDQAVFEECLSRFKKSPAP
jgi:glycosyltransferase involved in cell wall biosynthesis